MRDASQENDPNENNARGWALRRSDDLNAGAQWERGGGGRYGRSERSENRAGAG
jgi:hypothetical protein